jgi:uncharacterized membrane protein YecN with MAPEG domain
LQAPPHGFNTLAKKGEPTMILQTTLSLAAAAVAINAWLFVRCGQVRFRKKILHGDGGDPLMQRRVRAHANFIEHAPIYLILSGLIEMSGKGGSWLAIVGAVFMLARVGHVFGMDLDRPNPARAGGIFVSLFAEIGLAVVAVLIALGRI